MFPVKVSLSKAPEKDFRVHGNRPYTKHLYEEYTLKACKC